MLRPFQKFHGLGFSRSFVRRTQSTAAATQTNDLLEGELGVEKEYVRGTWLRQKKEDMVILCSQGGLIEGLACLDQQGFYYTDSFYASLLRMCGKTKALSEGRRIHRHIDKTGLQGHVFLRNLLIQMYGDCGSLEDARNIFDKISNPNIFSWTVIMGAYVRHGRRKEAIRMFRMMMKTVEPDKVCLVAILGACSDIEELASGRLIHACLIDYGFQNDIVVSNALINMYGKCRNLQTARTVFDEMPEQNLISWNAMISTSSQNGQGKEAMKVFQQMQQEGVNPDRITFISTLSACSTIAEGRMIHAYIFCAGLGERDTIIGTAIIHMYDKLCSLKDALMVFKHMVKRDVISWNAVIRAYEHGSRVFSFFSHMNKEGLKPDKVTYMALLNACASQTSLSEGKLVHALIINNPVEPDIVLGNAIMNMYTKCCSLQDTSKIFEIMHDHDIVSWNTRILASMQCGNEYEVLKLFQEMQQEGVRPDKATYISTLDGAVVLPVVKLLHAFIIDGGLLGMVVGTALINAYGKCSNVKDASRIFFRMMEQDIILWNAMITEYIQSGQEKQAHTLFWEMRNEGLEADNITYITILDGCAECSALSRGKHLHACTVESELETDILVGNALINMYGKCGSVKDAEVMFESMHEQDVVSWNAMLATYVQHGQESNSLKLFQQIGVEDVKPEKITFIIALSACCTPLALIKAKSIHVDILEAALASDVSVGTALVNMYGKCECLECACDAFNDISDRNLISWNAIIAAYSQHGCGKEAMMLFYEMQREGLKLDTISLATALDACANLTTLAEGRLLSAYIHEAGFESDVCVGNALVNMYGKCGNLNEASSAFEKLLEKNKVSWNSLIDAYAKHGHGKEVPDILQAMLEHGTRPDEITFVSFLCGCNHGGFLDEGLYYFTSISNTYGVTPTGEHYGCLIDLLGRMGLVHEVEDLISNLLYVPDIIEWTSLLSACQIHGLKDVAGRAARNVLELDPYSITAYVAMSNVYAGGDMLDCMGDRSHDSMTVKYHKLSHTT